MAFSNRGTNLPGIVAGADLSLSKHRLINIDSTGRAVLASAGGSYSAILENNPILDEAASLMGPGSVGKLVSAAAVPAGSAIASDATGRAIVAAAGDFVAGICVDGSAAVGELCSAFLSSQAGTGNAVFDDATRPDASTLPVGTCVWNSDDSAPNYSDGTAWRDAAGVLT